MQKLSLIGNLGADPEMRYTPSGKAVATYRLAVSTGRRDEQNEQITVWYKATCWEKKAELAAEYLRKGSKVYVEGEPGVDTWADKQTNETRTQLTINVGYMEFLSPRPQQDGGDNFRNAPSQSQRAVPRDDLDDLPF